MLETLESLDLLETLETLSAKMISNGPWILAGCLYAALVLGFLIALIVKRKSKGELQRIPYFVFTMALTVAGGAVAYTWFWALPAAAGRLLWVLAAVNLGSWLIIGYISGIIAAARARDAFGVSVTALLALIPVANLFLIFQPSRLRDSEKRITAIPMPRGASGLLLGIFMLAIYVALIGGHGIQPAANVKQQEQASSNADRVRNQIELMIRSRGLEVTLQLIATEGNKRLPRRINNVVRLVTLSAEGKRLKRTFMVNLDEVTLPENFRADTEKAICGYEPFKPLLREGATIEEIYKKEADGSLIISIPVAKETCEALQS